MKPETQRMLTRTTITGTMDELEPVLRSMGFTGVKTMAGSLSLSDFDPYGARRVGSVNVQSERWAHHIFRGCLAYVDGVPYIASEKPAQAPMIDGLFPLV